MGIESAARPAVKVTLVNLRTMEEQPVLANPTELETAIDVGWNNLIVPGLSHEPMQYKNTGNVGFTLTLECSEFDFDSIVLDDHERFLTSLCYPEYDANSILEGAPPRVLVVWPKVLSMQIVVMSLRIKRTQFASDGRALRFVATVAVAEIRDVRLSAGDVRTQGLRRSTSSSSGTTPTGTGNGSTES